MMWNNRVYFLWVFVIFAILLSSYFFPRTRDEFYYLPTDNSPNAILEFYQSYFFVNPRLGQFFSNLIGRNLWLKPIFNLSLFLVYMTVTYLFLYRKLPKINNNSDVFRLFIIAGGFIFLINYFGEMFYYVPFNTNYTLSHVFYLLYVFLIVEYYIYDKNYLDQKKILYFLIFICSFFMGWFNEHVPPVLVGISILLAASYIFKNKKIPDLKLLSLIIPITIGYCILFFAPANKLKFKGAKVENLGFQMSTYFQHFVDIAKLYFYYNKELCITFVFCFVVLIYNFKFVQKEIRNTVFLLILISIMVLLVVAYSPLQGTRLLFFSNSLIIIICGIITKELLLKNLIFKKNLISIISIFICLFFAFSIAITYVANRNYNKTMLEITNKSKKNKNVILDNSFEYASKIPFNRRILLDSGRDYIDNNPKENTSVEQILLNFFGLKSISKK
ncbi:MAG: hypothetical protein JST62_11935 [Bacteroidetes bacterium]|nr:hypothetical protein [Bacteroidota bacterium]